LIKTLDLDDVQSAKATTGTAGLKGVLSCSDHHNQSEIGLITVVRSMHSSIKPLLSAASSSPSMRISMYFSFRNPASMLATAGLSLNMSEIKSPASSSNVCIPITAFCVCREITADSSAA